MLDDSELLHVQKLQHGAPVSLPPALEQDLRARRYLFDDSLQEEAFLEQAVTDAWARMQTRQPETYTVCPTLACNLACAYCFEGDSLLDKPQGVMTEPQVEQLFEAITQIRRDAAGRDRPLPTRPGSPCSAASRSCPTPGPA